LPPAERRPASALSHGSFSRQLMPTSRAVSSDAITSRSASAELFVAWCRVAPAPDFRVLLTVISAALVVAAASRVSLPRLSVDHRTTRSSVIEQVSRREAQCR
jgi:hypothetical protein